MTVRGDRERDTFQFTVPGRARRGPDSPGDRCEIGEHGRAALLGALVATLDEFETHGEFRAEKPYLRYVKQP